MLDVEAWTAKVAQLSRALHTAGVERELGGAIDEAVIKSMHASKHWHVSSPYAESGWCKTLDEACQRVVKGLKQKLFERRMQLRKQIEELEAAEALVQGAKLTAETARLLDETQAELDKVESAPPYPPEPEPEPEDSGPCSDRIPF